MRTLIFRTAAPYLTALMLLFSVFVLLRGHNEPGGGFIGGLIAASAFAIHGIAFGVPTVRRALHFHPMAISGFGLLLARSVGTAVACARRAVPDRPVDFADLSWQDHRLVDGDAFRHRRLSRRGRLDRLDRAGARGPGGRLMEAVFSLLVGLFFAVGIYLILSRHIIRIVLGIAIFGNAVNLLIFTSGRIMREAAPIIPHGLDLLPGPAANPLPQALILTAIVISFSFFAFVLVLAYRAYQEIGADDTSGMRVSEPRDDALPPMGY